MGMPLQTLRSQRQPDLARRTAVLAMRATAGAVGCDARALAPTFGDPPLDFSALLVLVQRLPIEDPVPA